MEKEQKGNRKIRKRNQKSRIRRKKGNRKIR